MNDSGFAQHHRAAKAAAETLYGRERLNLPPLPEGVGERWVRVGEAGFASEPWPEGGGLSALEPTLGAILSGRVGCPYAAFGLVGESGSGSEAVCLYYSTPRMIAAVQAERDQYDDAMKAVESLNRFAEEAAARGAFPADRRIVAVESRFFGNRWAWIPAGAGEIDWRREERGALIPAAIAVAQLGRGLA